MADKIIYLPFNAINEFMLPDYRREVIRTVLSELQTLNEGRQKSIIGLLRKNVQIQGFRNSALAPISLKVNGSTKAFEKSAQFVGVMLNAWCEIKHDLALRVLNLLESRGWKILPIEVDRSVLPGFQTRWPAHETFELMISAYLVMFPDSHDLENDINLMVVWLSNRLPYEMVSENLFATDAE